MSDKEKLEEQLSAYLDGELSETDGAKVERALEGDEDLARRLGELRGTRELLRTLPRQHAGDQFVSQVLTRAERGHLIRPSGESDTPRRTPWVRWVASAAVLLIAAGICVVITAVLTRSTFLDDRDQASGVESSGEIARDLGDLPAEPVASTDDESRRRRRGTPDSEVIGESVIVTNGRPAKPARLDENAKADASVDRLMGTAAGEALRRAGGKDSRVAKGVPAKRLPKLGAPPTAGPRPVVDATLPSDSTDKAGGEDVTFAFKRGEGVAARAKNGTFAKMGRRGRALSITGTAGVHVDGDAVAELSRAHNEFVYTDDLPGTQRQVEEVLGSNGIVPVTLGRPTASNAERVRFQQGNPISNYSQLIPRPGNQVEYFAYVTPEQMKNVNAKMIEIRKRQVVSQTTITRWYARAGYSRGGGTALMEAPVPEKREAGQVVAGTAFEADRFAYGYRATAAGTQPARAEKAYVAVVDTPDGKLELKEIAEDSLGVVQRSRLRAASGPPSEEQPRAGDRKLTSQLETGAAGAVQARRRETRANIPLLITLNLRSPEGEKPTSRAATEPATQEALSVPAPPAPKENAPE